MSTLSAAEQTAGISRKALKTMEMLSQRNTVGDVSKVITGYRAHRVVDTPMRLLEVLECLTDGRLLLRSTTYDQNHRATVAGFSIDYHEAHAFSGVLRDLEPPEDSEPPKNGKTRP